MKKIIKKIITLVIIVLVVVFFYPKAYESSPGFVTPEVAQEFEQTKKTCFGFSYLTNPMEIAADASGRSLCFGWLL